MRTPRSVRLAGHLVKFDLVSLVIIIAVFGVFIFSGFSMYRQFAQANRTHDALCAYKLDTQHRYDDSQKFLLMSPEQRVKKYGKQLAHIPDATVRRGLETQKSILDALRFLDC